MNAAKPLIKIRMAVPWIVLGGILLLSGCVLCVNRYLEYESTGAREQERLLTQARVIDKNLGWNLQALRRVLAALQKEHPQRPRDPGVDERLKILGDALPGVRTLVVMDAGGTIRAASRPELVGRNFREREYFRTARLHPDPETLLVSSPFRSSLGVYSLIVARVVPGPDGGFGGMVTATLDPAYLTTLLSSVLYAPDMAAAVFHGDGTPLVSVPGRVGPPGKGDLLPDPFLTRHRASGRENSVFAGSDSLHRRRGVMVWHTLQPAGLKMDRPLLVTVGRDLDAVYRRWRFETRVRVGILLVLAAVSALGIYLFRVRQWEYERQMVDSALLLRESTERLRLATTAAGLGVWEYHPLTGRLLWDDGMFALYGCDREVFSHDYQAWRGCVLPEELPALDAALKAAIEERLPFRATFRIRRGDGELRSITSIGQVTSLSDGGGVRVIGVNEDVTERREAAAALTGAMESADAANRAKTEFLANMSHEIRTPMNAILGLLYLLQKTGLNARQWDYAGKIRQAASSLLDILNDILDFSKVEAGRMELELVPFSLDDLLRNMSVILSANSQDKDIEVLFAVDPGVPDRLVGDPLRLQQVLINLAGNAVKFTDRGEVVISVSLEAREAERVRLLVSIRDTGIGISRENLERIFEGFTQAEVSTSRRFGGTGLGLAISSRLVRLMGGEIEARSEEGKGSVFRFAVSFSLQAAPGEGEPREPSSAGRALRLLLVDDNDTARELLTRMVQSLGWCPEAAEEGGRALMLLEEARAAGQRHDAVLIDWRMPGVEGVEAASRIREHCRRRGIPVIVLLTSYGREALTDLPQNDAGSAGGYLLKPVTRSMLLDAVEEALRGNALAPSPDPLLRRRRLQGVQLLLAEDNKVNQMVAREILEGEGALVVVVDNGREAVGRIRSGEMRFDAVLMDLQMPVMDGYQATREIRETLGETTLPIVAMTANAFDTDRQRCLEAGLNAHLSKPIDVERVVETLRGYCLPNEGEDGEGKDGEELTFDAAELAGLPGLNLADTLKRLNGNRALYSQIARMVCSRYAEVDHEVRRLCSAGERGLAVQLLHTFKGVVLNLGAGALGECLLELEKVLPEEGGGDGEGELLARFEALWREAAASLRLVAERYGAPPLREREASPGAPKPSLREHLQQLMAYLEESNMESLDCFASFMDAFGAELPAERMAWIAEAIEQLDFAAALEFCSVLDAVLEEG